jgi:hypothetical protein
MTSIVINLSKSRLSFILRIFEIEVENGCVEKSMISVLQQYLYYKYKYYPLTIVLQVNQMLQTRLPRTTSLVE